MGDLRDQVDVAATEANRKRSAAGGGPRQYARNVGRARAGARFPAKRGRRHKR